MRPQDDKFVLWAQNDTRDTTNCELLVIKQTRGRSSQQSSKAAIILVYLSRLLVCLSIIRMVHLIECHQLMQGNARNLDLFRLSAGQHSPQATAAAAHTSNRRQFGRQAAFRAPDNQRHQPPLRLIHQQLHATSSSQHRAAKSHFARPLPADRRTSTSTGAGHSSTGQQQQQKPPADPNQGKLLICYYTTRHTAPYWPKDAREFVVPADKIIQLDQNNSNEHMKAHRGQQLVFSPVVGNQDPKQQYGNKGGHLAPAARQQVELEFSSASPWSVKNQQQQLFIKTPYNQLFLAGQQHSSGLGGLTAPGRASSSSSSSPLPLSLSLSSSLSPSNSGASHNQLATNNNGNNKHGKQQQTSSFGHPNRGQPPALMLLANQPNENNNRNYFNIHNHDDSKPSVAYHLTGDLETTSGLAPGSATGQLSAPTSDGGPILVPMVPIAPQTSMLSMGNNADSNNNNNNLLLMGNQNNYRNNNRLDDDHQLASGRPVEPHSASFSTGRVFMFEGSNNNNNKANNNHELQPTLDTKSPRLFVPPSHQQASTATTTTSTTSATSTTKAYSQLASSTLAAASSPSFLLAETSPASSSMSPYQRHDLVASVSQQSPVTQRAKSLQVSESELSPALPPQASPYRGPSGSPVVPLSNPLIQQQQPSTYAYRNSQQQLSQSVAVANANTAPEQGQQQQATSLFNQKVTTPPSVSDGNFTPKTLVRFPQPVEGPTNEDSTFMAPKVVSGASSPLTSTPTTTTSGTTTTGHLAASSSGPSQKAPNSSTATGSLSSALVSSPLSTMFDVFGAASQYLMRFKPSSLISPSSFASLNNIGASDHHHHQHQLAKSNGSSLLGSSAASLIALPFSTGILSGHKPISLSSSSSSSSNDRTNPSASSSASTAGSPSSSSSAGGFLSRLTLQNNQRREEICGRTIQTPERRIIGGEGARYGEFPYQVHIKIAKHQCGGALVDRQSIVTAAHCVYHFITRAPVSKLQIVIGAYDIEDEQYQELPPQYFKVNKVKLHPNFRFSASHPDRYDIAILKLDKPVKYTDNVLPVCLPSRDLKFESMVGTVTGFGKTDPSLSNRYGTRLLQKVDVPIIENNECERWHRTRGIDLKIFPEMMCAGYEDGLKDACVGDSGGPLVVKTATGPNGSFRWTLAGITSAGFGCAQSRQPGIYHRVSHTVDWILENLD